MRRLHPLTLALLAAHGLEAAPRKRDAEPPVTSNTVPEPPTPRPRFMINRDERRRIHPIRTLMGQPVKREAPRNTQADERRRQRLRTTIMKRVVWFEASRMWGLPEPDIERLIKSGISRAVLCDVLLSEPPPQNHAPEEETAADSCDPPRAERQDLAPVMQDEVQERLAQYHRMMETLTPEQVASIAAEVKHHAIPYQFSDPEVLEETVREVTAELREKGMVIIDDVGVVPPEVWLAEPKPPEGSWVRPLLDLENRAAHERHKGTITFPTATPSGWGEIEQSKGDDHGNADAADADGLPDRGPGEADPGGIRR